MRTLVVIKRNIALFLINKFLCGTHFFKVKNKLLNWSGIKCGINSKVVGPINFGSVISVTIGNNVWVGQNCSFHGNGKVNLSDNIDIAPDVSFLTGSHLVSCNPKHRAGEGVSYEIFVENGVWIGARATIMGNTTIEQGVVIGACSLVNKTLNSNRIYGGVPAKVILELNDME